MNPTLLRLLAGQISIHACMTGLRMGMPLYALHHGHSAAEAGVLIALFALSNVVMALPWGRLVDRHGLHRPWRLAMAMSASGAGLAAGWPQFGTFCVASLLVGGAMGLAQVTVQRRAGHAVSDVHARRQLWGWLSLAAPAANLVGPALVGLLLDHAGQATLDRAAFTWAALTVGTLALSSAWWLRGVAETPRALAAPNDLVGDKRDLLRDPQMRRLLLVAWATASCWDVHAFVVPVLGHERGFSASMIGLILGAFALAAAVVRPLLPRLTAGLSERRLMTGALTLTATLLVLYPLAHHPWWAATLSALLGLTLGGVQPMILSTLQHITPPQRIGQALGMRLMTVSATSVTMPLLFGSFGAAIGVSALFWCAAIIAAAGGRVAWTLRASPAGITPFTVRDPGSTPRSASPSDRSPEGP